MSRGDPSDLPLFDLPLHDSPDGDELDGDELDGDKLDGDKLDGGSAFEEGREAERGAGEQSRLFDDSLDDGVDGDGHSDGVVEPLSQEDNEVGVLDRLIGGMIDVSIHALVLLVVGGATWLLGVRPTAEDWPAFAAFLLLFSLLYTGVPLAFWGQTPGMMRVGHVARTGSGEPLTFGQTALRWLGALLTLALAGLPLLLSLAGSRSLADRVSGSYTEPA